MITAWARLSEANAGLTGKVTIRSASATSWFSSPIRSRPNRMPTVSPAAISGAASCLAASAASTTGLAWSCARAVVASTSVQSAIAASQRVIEHGVVEDAVGAGGHLARLRVRPASRGLTSRSRDSPKFAMARAAAPMFSPSCGSTRITTGPGCCTHRLVLSVPAPGMQCSSAGKCPEGAAPAQAGRLRQAAARVSGRNARRLPPRGACLSTC